MLVHIALGGNALLRRGEPMTPDNQREKVRIAAQAIAPVAAKHDVVIGHGNGPQGGRRARQPLGSNGVETDALGARGEGRIGYMIEQELGNLLPSERPFATLLTMVEVDPDDPAFANPTKFVGPVYDRAEALRLAGEHAWVFKRDGDKWRRVVASPQPKRIVEVRPIKWLLDRHTVVIAADGGGIPTMHVPGAKRKLTGVECVVEKDLASELLARELGVDLYVMLTDAEAVYADWGKPAQKAIRRVSPRVLESMRFAAGSMGPKVAAACRFATATGKRAAIGALADLEKIVTGQAGTIVTNEEKGIVYHGAAAAASPEVRNGHWRYRLEHLLEVGEPAYRSGALRSSERRRRHD